MADPDLAAAALRALAARHEALRTKVSIPRQAPGYQLTGNERPSQYVDEESGFTLRRHEGDGEFTATEFMRLVGDRFDDGVSTLDPASDPSVGMIYRRPDRRYGCLIITSRLFTDGPGSRRLGEEFHSLVAGVPAGDLPPVLDPLTLAAEEAGSVRQGLSRRNLAAMVRLLHQAPDELLVRPRGIPASATMTRSPTLAAHVLTLSQRFGVPKGGVVTALVGALQWAEHGHPTVLVRALTQLPPPVRGAVHVAPNALPALSAVPVHPAWTLREFFARAWAAIVGSYRTCAYDPAVFDQMQHDLAAPLGRELLDGIVYLNYHSMPEIFDWPDQDGNDSVLSHVALERHDRVFRTLFDIRDLSTSMTMQVEGAGWPRTGDTLRQSRALIDLAAAMADADGDHRTVAEVADQAGRSLMAAVGAPPTEGNQ
ncbi:hypothetical protein [Micromonospora sp. LOL_027]|uniref:hypothetical protein n=1 Tax=Micromonospora sp. LOL_027 TaxID=3345419 RepID=UPI003A854FFE